MGLLDKLRQARLASRVYDALEEAQKMGKLKAVVLALLAAVSVAIVAKVTDACPALAAQWQTMGVAAIGAAFMLFRQKVSTGEAAKTAAVAALVAAVGDQLTQVCGASFLTQLPTYGMAGLWAGIAHFLDKPSS